VNERLRTLRLARRLSFGLAGLMCGLLAAEVLLFRSLAGVVLAGVALGTSGGQVWRCSRHIGQERRELRRPDYARINELRYDTGRPIAEVVAAAERQAGREFARETDGCPAASGWDLGAAMAALGETMTLPRNLEADSLETMRIGMTRYTTPWSLWADGKRALWLRAGSPAETSPHGTVSMRVDLRRDGYHVFPPRGERYRPEPAAPPGAGSLPVAKLH
jgi:hypothetical protein